MLKNSVRPGFEGDDRIALAPVVRKKQSRPVEAAKEFADGVAPTKSVYRA